GARGRVAQSKASPAMAQYAHDLRPPGAWPFAGPGNRYGPRAEGSGAHLETEARNCEPGPWPDRDSSQLGNSTGATTRRKPSTMARPPRTPVAEESQDKWSGAPRRAAIP